MQIINEMVSLGDTAISLHILQFRSVQISIFAGGRCSGKSKYSEWQDLPKFQWGGCVLESQNTQSAKICLDFNFRGDGGGFWGEEGYSGKSKYSKCQGLPKFQFFLGGGWLGVLESQNTQSAKVCLNFNGGGGGGFWKVKILKVPRSA